MYGSEDKVLPSERYSQRFAAELRNGCQIAVIAKSGHSPHVECADQVAAAILKWIGLE
jgi:pimeloyl-ACP methyl ester carboxylesterase